MTISCWTAGRMTGAIGRPSSATCLGDTNVHSWGPPAAPVQVIPPSLRILADIRKALKVTCVLQPLLPPGQVLSPEYTRHSAQPTGECRCKCDFLLEQSSNCARLQDARSMHKCRSLSHTPGRTRGVQKGNLAAACPVQRPGALQKLPTGPSASLDSASPLASRCPDDPSGKQIGSGRSSEVLSILTAPRRDRRLRWPRKPSVTCPACDAGLGGDTLPEPEVSGLSEPHSAASALPVLLLGSPCFSWSPCTCPRA